MWANNEYQHDELRELTIDELDTVSGGNKIVTNTIIIDATNVGIGQLNNGSVAIGGKNIGVGELNSHSALSRALGLGV